MIETKQNSHYPRAKHISLLTIHLTQAKHDVTLAQTLSCPQKDLLLKFLNTKLTNNFFVTDANVSFVGKQLSLEQTLNATFINR